MASASSSNRLALRPATTGFPWAAPAPPDLNAPSPHAHEQDGLWRRRQRHALDRRRPVTDRTRTRERKKLRYHIGTVRWPNPSWRPGLFLVANDTERDVWREASKGLTPGQARQLHDKLAGLRAGARNANLSDIIREGLPIHWRQGRIRSQLARYGRSSNGPDQPLSQRLCLILERGRPSSRSLYWPHDKSR